MLKYKLQFFFDKDKTKLDKILKKFFKVPLLRLLCKTTLWFLSGVNVIFQDQEKG